MEGRGRVEPQVLEVVKGSERAIFMVSRDERAVKVREWY